MHSNRQKIKSPWRIRCPSVNKVVMLFVD